ncbi:MAG: hypothetical protein K6G11_07200 [Lachnospiraceae bacterium]|nr:hypothetical protein [Lachnospiraceae bacterium]
MRACGVTNSDTRKINNVVDDFFFEVSKSRDLETSKPRKTILHVSCFDEDAKEFAKNAMNEEINKLKNNEKKLSQNAQKNQMNVAHNPKHLPGIK